MTVTSWPGWGVCGAGSTVSSTDFDIRVIEARGLNLAAGTSCTVYVGLTIASNASGGQAVVSASDVSATVNSGTVLGSGDSASFTVSGGFGLQAVQRFAGPIGPGGRGTLTPPPRAGAGNSGGRRGGAWVGTGVRSAVGGGGPHPRVRRTEGAGGGREKLVAEVRARLECLPEQDGVAPVSEP